MSDLQPIVEIVNDHSVVAEPSEDDVMATSASQIDDMVDHFWRNTHQLAIEHALLANRQNVQAQHPQGALFAVHRVRKATPKTSQLVKSGLVCKSSTLSPIPDRCCRSGFCEPPSRSKRS
jgi:hypothetical protein